jgi:hypothetical protein
VLFNGSRGSYKALKIIYHFYNTWADYWLHMRKISKQMTNPTIDYLIIENELTADYHQPICLMEAFSW